MPGSGSAKKNADPKPCNIVNWLFAMFCARDASGFLVGLILTLVYIPRCQPPDIPILPCPCVFLFRSSHMHSFVGDVQGSFVARDERAGGSVGEGAEDAQRH